LWESDVLLRGCIAGMWAVSPPRKAAQWRCAEAFEFPPRLTV
jgi:hypothetical protein